MKKFLMALAVLALASVPAMAGPNAGGTLVVHDTGLVYTVDPDPYISDAPLCEDVDNVFDYDVAYVWKVYAAFPLSSSPRLKAVSWGTTFDPQIIVLDGGLPDPDNDFEVVQGGFPNQSGGGVGQSFFETQTDNMVMLYWFGGYAYYGADQPGMFYTNPHPTQEPIFVDDSQPAEVDPIAGYSSLGFFMPGETNCPQEPMPGACCFGPDCVLLLQDACIAQGGVWVDGPCDPNPCIVEEPIACCFGPDCVLLLEADCIAQGGVPYPDYDSCDPNPCPVPTEETSWGQIKANYR